MKFRTLSNEELSHLENDLKAFLIVNGVEGDTWEKINSEEPEKAKALVDVFSDQVLQIVYEKIPVLEHRTKNSCLVFRLLEDKLLLIAISSVDENVNLETTEGIHQALTSQFSSLDLFSSSKAYSKSREEEIHKLIEDGAIPSSLDFWESLKEIVEA